MRKFIVAAAAATVFAAPAYAQDAAASFTGGHIEVIGGLDHVGADGEADMGALYGISGGFDFGGSGTVFGIEAEAADSTTDQCDVDLTCVKTGRDLYVGGRIGAVVMENALVYAKAGYTNARLVLERDAPGTADDFSEGTNLDGVRVGVGVESNAGRNLVVKLEYRYSNYKNLDFSDDFDFEDLESEDFGTDIDLDRHQIMAGIGFRF